MAVICFRMPGYDSNDYAASEVLSDVLSSQRGDLYALVPQGKALFAGFSLSTLPQAGLGYAVAAFPQGADAAAPVGRGAQDPGREPEERVPAESGAGGQTPGVDAGGAAKELRVRPGDGLVASRRGGGSTLARGGRAGDPARDRGRGQPLGPAVPGLGPGRGRHPDAGAVRKAGHARRPPGGMESFAPRNVRAVELPDWAAKALGRLEVPPSTLRPVVSTLPNGLKLIVQPESISKTVSVSGHVQNEPALEAPQGKEGVDQVLDQLFAYGTTSLDRLAFQAALDEIGAERIRGHGLLPGCPGRAVRAGGATAGGQRASSGLTREAAFKVVQRAGGRRRRRPAPESGLSHAAGDERRPVPQRRSQPASSHTRDGEIPDALRRQRLLPKGLPAGLDHHRRHRQRHARAGAGAIGKYFGDWKAQGPKPNTLLPPVPPNRSSTVAVPDTRRVQDKVTLAETLGLNRFNPDYYALELGNHVLGGGFYATRLFRDLRKEAGLVYNVASVFHLDKTRGIYMVDYACDPPNVSKARALIVRALKDMQTAPVTEAELRQAQALLLREIPLSESSQDTIAQGLLSRAGLDLPLDEPTRAAERYIKLTAEEVRAAFAKWVRVRDLVQITQGPAPQ